MRMLVVAAAAALVAGCGGSGRLSKAQYEQRIQADGKAAQQAVTKAAGSLGSPGSLAAQISTARQAVKKAADDLDAAKPPKDAEADTHTIVVGLRTIETELGRLEGPAKKHDFAALQAGASALQGAPEIKAAQRAANDLKRKGYKIGVLGQAG
jgi:hypothetical protein